MELACLLEISQICKNMFNLILMQKQLLSLIVFSFLFAGFSQAQLMHYYGSEKLSCSLVKQMIQDAQGFVWIATENGLNKFDGWTFTNYYHNKKDSTSLLSNTVESLFKDSKGRLWVGQEIGLQRYSSYNDTFENVHFLDGGKPSVLALQELKTGELWAVTAGYGAYSINPETLEATPLTLVNNLCGSTYMHNIFQDYLSRIWIALDGRIVCISSDMQEIYSWNVSGYVYTILEDADKRLWIATVNDICLWDERKRNFIKMRQHEAELLNIRGLVCTKQGALYVNALNSGIWSVDVEETELKPFYNEGILARDDIRTLMADKDGNLWLGCHKNGIIKLSNELPQFDFRAFSSFSSSGNVLSSIYKDKDGDVWVGMTDGVLIRLNHDLKKTSSYFIENGIASMYEDSEGMFWLGNYSGTLMQFDKRTGMTRKFPLFQDKIIKGIIEGYDNALYVSVMSDGFARYDLSSKQWRHINDTTRLSTTMRLGNNWINVMMCDSKGMIWLGHCNGLNCYDPVKNQFLKSGCETALKLHTCYALLEDKRGHIWIGTNKGLFEYDRETEKICLYDVEQGMPSNVICGIGQSKQGDIWCSTFNGLCKLSHEDRKVTNYFSGNGLVDKEYLKGVYYQPEDDAMYVGGIHGITTFVPDSVRKQLDLNKPQLTHVYLNNEEVCGYTQLAGNPISDDSWENARHLNLTHECDICAFEFSTMEFRERKNIRFEYRLAELDRAWRSTAPGENRITYTYLPSGYYTFEVRTCENEQRSPVRSFSVFIAPPWYDTFWAKLGYVVVLLGIISWGFYAWYSWQRRRRQEELNEEKLKFFIDIAHELRSPITLIISPLSALLRVEQDEMKKSALQTMQRNANRIVQLINQLLDIRKIDKGQMRLACRETDMVGFMEELFQMFDFQAAKRNIGFSFVHSVEHLPVWIDRNNFDKVLMNLMVNAFKYTPDDGEITITLATGEDQSVHGPLAKYAEIIIVDSGMGLDEKKTEKIFERFYQASASSYGFGIGLNLTKMLVELHHGIITAANRTDRQGSIFTVRIPLGKEHLKVEELFNEADAQEEMTARVVLQERAFWEEKVKTQLEKCKTQWRILVVDDDEEMRKYLKQELGVYYKVVSACNGIEASQIALNQRIDLIISDVVMPEMDGFDLLKRVKSNFNINHIPFILLTSQTEYENRLRGWNVGADAFLTKPFRVEELLLICENLIRGRVQLKGHFGVNQEIDEKMKPIEVKANDEFLMERLMEAVIENLNNPKFSVEDLAEAVGLSRVQLHRKLKILTGNSTSEFIRNIRLKQAAMLLKEKKVNISQIAYLVGFTNPNLFSIAFKKFYGCSPSEYADREIGD